MLERSNNEEIKFHIAERVQPYTCVDRLELREDVSFTLVTVIKKLTTQDTHLTEEKE